MGDMAEKHWCWIRHAPVHSDGRIYGQSDLDCDCREESTFAGLARVLPRDALWVTSNLRRAAQTADAIRRWLPRTTHTLDEITVEARFAEQHLGDWQGLTRDQVSILRKGSHSVWLAHADERPKGGESFVDLIKRVTAGIQHLNVECQQESIVAVAHAGTIRAALCFALELTPERALAFTLDNCSVTTLTYLGEDTPGHNWRVGQVNCKPWVDSDLAQGALITRAPNLAAGEDAR